MAAPGSFQKHADFEHNKLWDEVDAYAIRHLNPNNAHRASLDYTKELSDREGLPNIEVSTLQADFLAVQCIIMQAKNVLEVGTLAGYSAIAMAATSPEVKVVSIEIDARHKDIAEQAIEHAGLSKQVEVVLGAGLDVLPQLRQDVEEGKRPKFDLVFIDADKLNNFAYFKEAVPMTRSGALVIVDNVVRRGHLANVELAKTDDKIRGSQQVVEGIGADQRILHTSLIQTVGEKNYDGFLMAVVK